MPTHTVVLFCVLCCVVLCCVVLCCVVLCCVVCMVGWRVLWRVMWLCAGLQRHGGIHGRRSCSCYSGRLDVLCLMMS